MQRLLLQQRARNCRLLTSGQFALVVDDSSHQQSGSFFVTANRLSSPEGCTAMSSVSFEATPTGGSSYRRRDGLLHAA